MARAPRTQQAPKDLAKALSVKPTTSSARVYLTVLFCAADPVGDGLFKEGKSPSWGPLSPAVQKGEPAGEQGWRR